MHYYQSYHDYNHYLLKLEFLNYFIFLKGEFMIDIEEKKNDLRSKYKANNHLPVYYITNFGIVQSLF